MKMQEKKGGERNKKEGEKQGNDKEPKDAPKLEIMT
jgi:hypothetical protein